MVFRTERHRDGNFLPRSSPLICWVSLTSWCTQNSKKLADVKQTIFDQCNWSIKWEPQGRILNSFHHLELEQGERIRGSRFLKISTQYTFNLAPFFLTQWIRSCASSFPSRGQTRNEWAFYFRRRRGRKRNFQHPELIWPPPFPHFLHNGWTRYGHNSTGVPTFDISR